MIIILLSNCQQKNHIHHFQTKTKTNEKFEFWIHSNSFKSFYPAKTTKQNCVKNLHIQICLFPAHTHTSFIRSVVATRETKQKKNPSQPPIIIIIGDNKHLKIKKISDQARMMRNYFFFLLKYINYHPPPTTTTYWWYIFCISLVRIGNCDVSMIFILVPIFLKCLKCLFHFSSLGSQLIWSHRKTKFVNDDDCWLFDIIIKSLNKHYIPHINDP